VTMLNTLPRPDTIALLDVEPELGRLLTPQRAEEARAELVARVATVRAGPWADRRVGAVAAEHVGLLLVDGVLARETVLADIVSTHLLGPGDVARPWASTTQDELVPAASRWTAVTDTRVALLDQRLAMVLGRFPEVNAMLIDRLAEQMGRMAVAQAIGRLTGVDRRLLALFWHLAERWGRVTRDGIVVPLVLPHNVLADLVGARRPTVSTALQRLMTSGEVVRRSDRTWLLTGTPVGRPTPDATRVVAHRYRRAAPPRRSPGADLFRGAERRG
jgi:CRP/FNR family cyclic AMP-dependent transcriptional regulator